MTKQELAELLPRAESAAMNVDALLTLMEHAAWNICNRTIVDEPNTAEDARLGPQGAPQ